MSVKGVVGPYTVVTNQTMASAITSLPTVVLGMDNASYQVTYSGSPVGAFTVESSNDGASWSALVFSTTVDTTTASSPFLINLNQLPYAQIRLRYTPTSGSGTMNAIVVAKRLGG